MSSLSKISSKIQQQQSPPPLTTDITMVNETEEHESSKSMPEWIRNARGLVYQHDYDGFNDPDAVEIKPPECVVDANTQSVYQCIKCGNKQFYRDDIHRMKCTRCYNKAFNKVRPTKWVKFKAY